MTVSEKPLQIDIPIKLSDVKLVFSIGALDFEGDFPASIFHLQMIKNDIADWNAESRVIAVFHTNPVTFRRDRANRLGCLPGEPMVESNPPVPPFTLETATEKVRKAEDAWNSRDPLRVARAYTGNSRWRNRAEFVEGRAAIEAFLTRKWNRERDYRLIKEIWTFRGNRIAVRFAYEWHDDSGHWFRSYGNENWEFDENGLMRVRIASINDVPIKDTDRKYHWPLGRRSDDHQSLSDLGL